MTVTSKGSTGVEGAACSTAIVSERTVADARPPDVNVVVTVAYMASIPTSDAFRNTNVSDADTAT